MTAYESACAAACRWCAEGSNPWKTEDDPPRTVHSLFPILNRYPSIVDCTAPTKDELIEQQAARIAELQAELLKLKTTVKVHVGTSALSKDLVWCECGRGLSLSGKWLHCPSCGRPIDQDSYQAAVEEAKRNGASHFCRDPEMLQERLGLRAQRDEMLEALRKSQDYLEQVNSLEWPMDAIRAAIAKAEDTNPQRAETPVQRETTETPKETK